MMTGAGLRGGAAWGLALAAALLMVAPTARAQDAQCTAPHEAKSLEHAPLHFRDRVAKGLPLKAAFAAARAVMDPKFSDFAIYEHCLPFNVSRAYDEARGMDHPAIWTAERDREMWAHLQG